jgi:5-methylthioadenosine/S-adenosylhomocysteine deaminase
LLVGADGRIEAVGVEDHVPRPADAVSIALGDAALLPGLVNLHAHPELTALRGLLEDLPFHEWIPALMRAKRGARLVYDDFVVSARQGCIEAVRAGITTLGVTEDSGASLDALIGLGLRGIVFREVFAPSPEQADAAMLALRQAVDAMRARETDLVRTGISPHAPFSVCDDLFEKAADFARDEKLQLAVHVAESDAERLLVVCGTGPFAERLRARGIATPVRGTSTIDLLDRTRILAEGALLIHCVNLSGEDIDRIAGAGAAVAHCPIANARLGHGIAPVLEMRAAGITVGMGTDSVASNNRVDLLEECRTAQILQRARHRSPSALPAASLLRMATLDGARALGLDGRIGSLEPGKDADLCAVDLGDVHARPVNDPLAALFHSARAPDVLLVAVRGRMVFHRQRQQPIPDAADAEHLDDVARRLRAALAPQLVSP